jgi:hypothetical protein
VFNLYRLLRNRVRNSTSDRSIRFGVNFKCNLRNELFKYERLLTLQSPEYDDQSSGGDKLFLSQVQAYNCQSPQFSQFLEFLSAVYLAYEQPFDGILTGPIRRPPYLPFAPPSFAFIPFTEEKTLFLEMSSLMVYCVIYKR